MFQECHFRCSMLCCIRAVKTRLFGKNTVYAIVTKPKNGSSFRLFFSTKAPEELGFDIEFSPNRTAAAYAEANAEFIPLTIYAVRWNIEVSYYEQKTFWSLGKYMLRSRKRIEKLINLISIVYSMMIVLPCVSEDFSFLKRLSPQQTRFVLGSKVQHQIFLSTFDDLLPLEKNKIDIRKIVVSQILHLIKAS